MEVRLCLVFCESHFECKGPLLNQGLKFNKINIIKKINKSIRKKSKSSKEAQWENTYLNTVCEFRRPEQTGGTHPETNL